MATFMQRGQAVGNALINGSATVSQLDRLGRALAYKQARLSEYEDADNAGKAQIYIEAFRALCLHALREYEGAAAVQASKESAEVAVGTDFQEAP